MKNFTCNDIKSLNKRYRAQLINSLSGFKSVNLIGTHDIDFHTNLAIFSSVVHLGASPALVGFIMRPANVERHTLDNIVSSNHFTINQVPAEHYLQAHQCSARYGKYESEFRKTGFTEQYINTIDAPFVKESRLKYAVKLKEIMPITLNETLLVIGEIIHIICEEKAIKSDGFIDIESLGTVNVSGLDSYHKTTRLSRLSYAKANQELHQLNVEGDILRKSERCEGGI